MAESFEAVGRVEYPPPPFLAVAIGHLVMHFSYAETATQFLIWRILGVSFQDGRALTGRLDARPKRDLLNELCGRHIKSSKAADILAATTALEHASSFRNLAAHGDWRCDEVGQLYSFSIIYDVGDPGETGLYGVKPVKLADLVAAAQDCQTATAALWAVDDWLKETPRESW